jgi:hypothetical protein
MASSYANNSVVVFGGTDGSALFNRTFLFELTAMTGVEVGTAGGPSARIDACATIWQDCFYLFSGQVLQNKTYVGSTEFWELNLTTSSWRLILSNATPHQYCELYTDQNIVFMVGECLFQTLLAFQYSPSTKTTTTPIIEYHSQAIIQSTLWDGTVINSSIPIEQAPPNATLTITQSYMDISSTSRFHVADSFNASQKVLEANNNIYSFTYLSSTNTLQIKYLASKQYAITSQAAWSLSASWQDWNIECTLNNQNQFFMVYFNSITSFQDRITNTTHNFYTSSWPDFSNSSYSFSLRVLPNARNQSSLLLVVHQTLLAYHLHQDPYFHNATDSTPSGLNSSFFGLNQCDPGWQLPACDSPTCPGSLILNSIEGLRAI